MKFLEINKFAELTAQLTEANICERVINGRIEAFTMKRAGTDKKYAHALGEKYQHEIQVEETEMNNLKKNISQQRNRSGSFAGNSIDSTGSGSTNASGSGNCNSVSGKKRSNSTSSLGKDGSSRKRNGKSCVSRRRPSPKSKRVRIITDPTNTGRRRSSSMSSVPASSPSLGLGLPPASAMRSRSDSFNASHSKVHNNMNMTTPNLNFPYSNSPLGDFHETCTQRLMTDLILTLNASFPDYDFSTIRPQHFAKVPSTQIAMNRTNEKLSELAASTPQGATFLPHLYSSIDEVIHLSECEVYSYVPPSRDDDDDPLSFLTQTLDGMESSVPLWSFNFFFVNKSLKRIVLLTCVQTMRTEMAEMEMEEMGMEEYQYQSEEQDSSGVGMGIHGGGGIHGLYGASSSDGLENDQFGTPGREATPSNHSRSMSYNVVEEDDDEEEEGGLDFDMDADAMNQAVSPPATVA